MLYCWATTLAPRVCVFKVVRYGLIEFQWGSTFHFAVTIMDTIYLHQLHTQKLTLITNFMTTLQEGSNQFWERERERLWERDWIWWWATEPLSISSLILVYNLDANLGQKCSYLSVYPSQGNVSSCAWWYLCVEFPHLVTAETLTRLPPDCLYPQFHISW